MNHVGLAAATTPTQTKAGTWQPDFYLLMPVAVLLSLGLVTVYSSSTVYAGRVFADPQRFLWSQLIWMGIGVLVLGLCACIPRRILHRRAGWLMLAALFACTAVLLPGVGHWVGGARRWLLVGPVSCQPSEACKLAVVILLAALLSQREKRQEQDGKSLLLAVLLVQIPVALILLEPDLGTALVIELLMMLMVFAAGVRLRTLGYLVVLALPVLYQLIFGTPFRLRRILGYLDPWAYRSTIGYQVTEALISIGSGGVWGVGLGAGKQKMFFLPEAHTDFIFAILAEELGLVGVLALLLVFAMVLYRGMHLAMHASQSFDRHLALGLTALVGVPAVFNVCVATGLLPTKGLPLPFISYGGSNLVVSMAAIGLLLRIDRDMQRDKA